MDFDSDVWDLYNLDEDLAEIDDLADQRALGGLPSSEEGLDQGVPEIVGKFVE